MELSDGDRVEQLPYVNAGFAVVSFDISGPSSAGRDTKELQEAMRAFRNAECGIKDAFEGLALAQAKYPQIDRDRVYVAGHSSAGTLALQIATSTNQIRACVAYAPICDLEQRLGQDDISSLDRWVPGMAITLQDASPKNRVARLNCPVFLFHSLDDDNALPGPIIAFKNALVGNRARVEYVSVAAGGHYNSMIMQGIPKAIEWLKRIDNQAKK